MVFALPSLPAMWLEDAAVQLVLGLANQVDRWRLLHHQLLPLQRTALQSAVVLGLLWWLASRLSPRARRIADTLLVLPPVLAMAGVLSGLALGLAPGWLGLFTGAVLLGGRAGAFLVPPADATPSPPTGTGARIAGAFFIAFLGWNGLTLLASGPGDVPVPLAAAEAWEALPGRPEQAIAVVTALFLPLLGRRASMAALPLAFGSALGLPGCGALALGVALAFLGARHLSWSRLRLPDPSTESLLRSAGAICAAALATILQVGATGFLDCDAVRADPRLRMLSSLPGTFSVATTDQQALVVLRDRGAVLHVDLRNGRVQERSLLSLPSPAMDAQVRTGGRLQRVAYPEEVAVDPKGRFHLFAEVPGEIPTNLVVRLSGIDGSVETVADWPGFCTVSSWAWDADRGRALVGCEWRSELLDYDAEDLADVVRRPIEGEGEVEELLPAGGGRWDTLSLWTSPWLRRVELPSGRVLARRYVGTFGWEMVRDDGGLLWIARFHAGQLLGLDAETLSPVVARRVGHGIRGLVWDRRHGRLLAASTYDGWLRAADRSGPLQSMRIGGWVRDIDLAEEGRIAVFGGLCGVFVLDLDAWLGPPGSS